MSSVMTNNGLIVTDASNNNVTVRSTGIIGITGDGAHTISINTYSKPDASSILATTINANGELYFINTANNMAFRTSGTFYFQNLTQQTTAPIICGPITATSISTNSINVPGSIIANSISTNSITVTGSISASVSISASSFGFIRATGGQTVTTSGDKYSFMSGINASSNNGLNSSQAGSGFPNVLFSIWADNRIYCSTEIDVGSDNRIKTNIRDISSNSALNIIRKIQPKMYNYKDTIQKGNKTNYGFIAQEVFEECQDSINKITDFIPNIYSLCEIENNCLTFKTFSTKDFDKNCNTIKLKLFDDKDNETIINVKEILTDNSLLFNEEIKNGKYFVYGQEINNFHCLEKNVIFTLTTSAVKELDSTIENLKTELQQTHSIVLSQKTQIDALTSELSELKELVKGLINKP
jgi:hypothetical protein